MIEITLLGTGSPLPDPNRAGPSTLLQAGGANLLVDCGRGVLMRLAAAGCGADALDSAPAHAPAQRPHHRPRRRAHHAVGDVVRTGAAPGDRAARHQGRGRRDARQPRPGHRLPDRPPRRPRAAADRRGARAHRRRGLGGPGGARPRRAHRPPTGGAHHRLPRRARRRVGRDRPATPCPAPRSTACALAPTPSSTPSSARTCSWRSACPASTTSATTTPRSRRPPRPRPGRGRHARPHPLRPGHRPGRRGHLAQARRDRVRRAASSSETTSTGSRSPPPADRLP